ncbi:unnamed protein product, partial [Rotaria sp. Silwood2]
TTTRPKNLIKLLNFLKLVFLYANGLLNPLLYLILTQNFRDYIRRNKWSPWINRKRSKINHQTFIYRTKPIINNNNNLNQNQNQNQPTSFIIHHDDDQHAFVPNDSSSIAI